jgi:Fic family protein
MPSQTYHIPDLPPPVVLETPQVLKALSQASRALAELKGEAKAIPNQGILIDTLYLQEAKASSEIENIVTTQDELFQADLFPEAPITQAAREVALYRDALRLGFQTMQSNSGIISNNSIVDMFRLLKGRADGFRVTPGTTLKNDRTGDTVYVPPQDHQAIIKYMTTLERFINDDGASDLDPLIKMAIIHHQFESIHPFPDGNGRIGRIVNILYLTRTGLLDIPILYLSRKITRSKASYYSLLQDVRDQQGSDKSWQNWVIYMLSAVASTARDTLSIVQGLRAQMQDMKRRLREEYPKIYSQDLLNLLFRFPYTRIDFLSAELGVTRQTASKYLDQLSQSRFLTKHKAGRSTYYVNHNLVALFVEVSDAR